MIKKRRLIRAEDMPALITRKEFASNLSQEKLDMAFELLARLEAELDKAEIPVEVRALMAHFYDGVVYDALLDVGYDENEASQIFNLQLTEQEMNDAIKDEEEREKER